MNKELVKAAASGDSAKCEYILSMPGSNVSKAREVGIRISGSKGVDWEGEQRVQRTHSSPRGRSERPHIGG